MERYQTFSAYSTMDKVNKRKILLLSLICFIVLSFWGAREEHYLGRGFTYIESPSLITYWKRNDTLQFDISPKVLSYNNSWNFLLIKQRPNPYPHIEDTPYNYAFGRDTVYYFFIDKSTKKVTGPLLYADMELFLREKDLSQMLQKLESKKEFWSMCLTLSKIGWTIILIADEIDGLEKNWQRTFNPHHAAAPEIAPRRQFSVQSPLDGDASAGDVDFVRKNRKGRSTPSTCREKSRKTLRFSGIIRTLATGPLSRPSAGTASGLATVAHTCSARSTMT